MPRRVVATTTAVLALVLGAPSSADAAFRSPREGTAPTKVVVAVGDMACSPADRTAQNTCQQQATSTLATQLGPAAVLTLGDEQYETGSFFQFRHSYAQSWGPLRPLTFPVPGNHEYETPQAAGYFRYFRYRLPEPPGWYTYRLGSWRLYAINSECGAVDCGAERAWLAGELRKHHGACALMYMHRPRYASRTSHESKMSVQGFWRIAYRHHLDVALAGHVHGYERFHRMNADGSRDPDGLVSFIVGTGGRSLDSRNPPALGTAKQYYDDFGVLRLRLRRGSFGWRFVNINGETVDRGGRQCM